MISLSLFSFHFSHLGRLFPHCLAETKDTERLIVSGREGGRQEELSFFRGHHYRFFSVGSRRIWPVDL